MTHIGFVVGSLRVCSFNRTFASAAMELFKDLGVDSVEIDLPAFPFFSEDVEFPVLC